MTAIYLPLLAPVLLLLTALALRILDGVSPRRGARIAEAVGLGGFALSVAGGLAGIRLGSLDVSLAPGLVFRFDAISLIMLLLVSFIGWIVLRYARSYLAEAPGQARFTEGLLLTLGAVMVLVQSGHLVVFVAAWVALSLALQRLLLFHAGRPGARRAAAKKALVARASEVALACAAVALFQAYGTGEISGILAGAAAGQGGGLAVLAAALLAVAALLASAQFPTHVWLTEVMETPTPTSALLHAGVVNAGGFLLIRFADVMLLSPLVLAALVLLGGFTALFAGLVMLTQPAVKTALAWSTVAQMGFMVLQCGLALFPLALLHIVAHSLYKAHAFLSSGGAVTAVAGLRRPGPVAVPGLSAVTRAFAAGLAIFAAMYFGLDALVGLGGKSPQAVALGAILVFGVAYLIAQGLADAAPLALTRATSLYAAGATISYLLLQEISVRITAGVLPAAPVPGPLEWAIILLALGSFGAVALAQACLPLWAHHPAAQGLRVHLANGGYIGALTDRLMDGWIRKPSDKQGETA